MKIIKTVCHRDCPDSCFIDASVENGKLISTKGSTENPITQGFLCPRGMGDPKRVHSEKRVLYPHLRDKKSGANDFKKISWEEALKILAKKASETIDKYGSESVLLYDYAGNQGFLAWSYPHRLWSVLGATRVDYALCSTSGHEGIGLHYGLSYGVQTENVHEMDVITYWGNNAKVSSPHQWTLSKKARDEKGTMIISIDPRESETSKAADIHVRPNPGSDVALTYGIARYLIENDYVDTEFLETWALGYNKYKDEVLKWTPERVTEVTGLDWKTVENLGEIYNQRRPGFFVPGLGLQKSRHGAEAARAVALLSSLLGRHRSFHYSDSRGRYINRDYVKGKHTQKNKSRTIHQVEVGPHLQTGEFKFVFIYCSNPAATLPNQKAVRSGLSREDVFVVVHDTHWTETTKYADLVLPAPTNYEKQGINLSHHHLYCRLSKKAIEPLGESKDEVSLMQQIAKELRLTEELLFEDPWKAVRIALKDAFENGTAEDLLNGKIMKLRMKPLNEYQTPSGKIELYSSKAKQMGVSPLPEQLPIDSEEGWFTLMNSSISKYTHSQFIDVYGPIPQKVWINSEAASNMRIKADDEIVLYNDLGKIRLKAEVTDKLGKNVLWAPRPVTGLDGNPLNGLAESTPQTIGGGPMFNSIRVKIKHN